MRAWETLPLHCRHVPRVICVNTTLPSFEPRKAGNTMQQWGFVTHYPETPHANLKLLGLQWLKVLDSKSERHPTHYGAVHVTIHAAQAVYYGPRVSALVKDILYLPTPEPAQLMEMVIVSMAGADEEQLADALQRILRRELR